MKHLDCIQVKLTGAADDLTFVFPGGCMNVSTLKQKNLGSGQLFCFDGGSYSVFQRVMLYLYCAGHTVKLCLIRTPQCCNNI